MNEKRKHAEELWHRESEEERCNWQVRDR